VEKPPNKGVFIEADDLDKILMMTNAWIRQTKRVQECNANFVALQDWKASVLETLPDDAQVSNDDRWKDMRRPPQ
jgi:hypothetical protein